MLNYQIYNFSHYIIPIHYYYILIEYIHEHHNILKMVLSLHQKRIYNKTPSQHLKPLID
jgi:hypothetical protein